MAIVVLDCSGLLCPLPAIRTREALAVLAAGDALDVLVTDPEAPIDLAALAADAGRAIAELPEPGFATAVAGPTVRRFRISAA